MKTILRTLWVLPLLAVQAGFGQPAASVPSPKPIRSVFIVPTSPKDGRDPFFPESGRLYKSKATNQVAAVSALSIKGFSGIGTDRLVIINNHTFGVGDEGDVLTPGGRIHIRCLEISPGSVVVEANGQRHEIKF